METRALSIYIHIPFCVRKCRYCDFLSFSTDCSDHEGMRQMSSYVKDLLTEIEEFALAFGVNYHVRSVFLGGGTPSILTGGMVHDILDMVRKSFTVDADCEISMECNPGTVDRVKLAEFHSAGVNRLSIGLQSTVEEELKALGRIHTYEDFLKTYEAALKVGFTNINVDLMSAIPHQSLASYRKSLANVLRLKPSHISAYSLILEEGTPMGDAFDRGEELYLPDEETERDMYHITREELGKAGYERYEISNYAKPGKACRHNIVYWERDEYVGFGLGASSMLRLGGLTPVDGVYDCRLRNTSSLDSYHKDRNRWRELADYIEQHRVNKGAMEPDIPKGFEEFTHLSKKDCMEEFMFLGLRMMKGVSKSQFRQLFSRQLEHVYGDVIRKYVESGHLAQKEDRIYLTEAGIDVSNVIFADFLRDE